jgi:hypothetical protein
MRGDFADGGWLIIQKAGRLAGAGLVAPLPPVTSVFSRLSDSEVDRALHRHTDGDDNPFPGRQHARRV